MANEEHLAILKRDTQAWNEWRLRNPETRPDLYGVNLTKENLHHVDLHEADLRFANFTGANLRETIFTGADLQQASFALASLGWAILDGSDLSNAGLEGAELVHASLSNANLEGADLTYTTLLKANLAGADLGGARMNGTTFASVDLGSTRGLEGVYHLGPSTIGIDTIYLSKGKIPDVFLRGAGVPEPFIANMNALVAAMEPIEFYSCFVSYSTKDEDFAQRLYADLRSKNVRCWFAPHDVRGGKKLHEQIDEAIRLHEKVLLILSAESMASEWVKTEIAKARKREVWEKKQVLFPVRLVPFEAIRDWECFDADAGKDSAREIREYFIPDFSQWKDHDKYKEAFERLLEDLKSSGE